MDGDVFLLSDKTLTYISLFSCAGVGCFGFKQAGYKCIATNELVERLLNVQRFNEKCEFDTGYICGDIMFDEVKQLIFNEVSRWSNLGNDYVDVIIATPPCQGMSVANMKKSERDIVRNSLVIQAVNMVSMIKPRFFVFENVPSFMRTICMSENVFVKPISDMIFDELGSDYEISYRVLNFGEYGSNSSRRRTLVIGYNRKLLSGCLNIEDLFPCVSPVKTVRQVIGHLPKLQWGEISSDDFYHGYRTYPLYMKEWIHDLSEGMTAFDNPDVTKRPYKIVDGQIVFNKFWAKTKYCRQYWDKLAKCILTRNDSLASQNTIHPSEDRVFSIREVMLLQTVPFEFKWVDKDLLELNALSLEEKQLILKRESLKIRHSIGEAVPTNIFYKIACNIKNFIK